MNSSLRKVTLVLGLAFVALFANLNVVQLVQSRSLSSDPRNDRNFLEQIGRRRGEILAANGRVIAESDPVRDGPFEFERRYPLSDLFAHVTGFYTPDRRCRSAGLESSFNDELIGDQPPTVENFVDELLGRERNGNVLQITIDPRVQRVAAKALGEQRGSVAAIDPRTGAVLALYSWPTFDPNRISEPASGNCFTAYQKLANRASNPLLLHATQERYPAGSTFKIITASAALNAGMTPATQFPVRTSLNLPDTDKNLRNFGNGTCGGTIAHALEVSCNTEFGEIGLKLGARTLGKMAERFGLDRSVDFDIPAVTSCVVSIPGAGCNPPSTLSRPATAYTAIGQQSVGVTALQMASVGATVSNGGFVHRPYLVQKVLDPSGAVLRETEPVTSKRIYSKTVAEQMKQMMIGVVQRGTGAVVGFADAAKGIIGGKTGTAQTGGPNDPPHVWFVAFAPDVAVAVVVENGGDLGFNATGGRVAGPIAKAVLEKVRALNAKARG